LKSNLEEYDAKALARLALASERPSGPLAVVQVCSRLRLQLSPVVGVVGFRTLLHRSLTLSKSKVDGFDKVTVSSEGMLLGLGDFEGLGRHTLTSEGGVILISNLLMLLEIFIGEALTRGLLNEIWPVFRPKSASDKPHPK
jgi:hypothetical protein